MSLDAFLEDVPADKLVVLGNHRSAQSNVVFIRNSVEGRKLGRDWLSIAVSGYVQCHGFDQVKMGCVRGVWGSCMCNVSANIHAFNGAVM